MWDWKWFEPNSKRCLNFSNLKIPPICIYDLHSFNLTSVITKNPKLAIATLRNIRDNDGKSPPLRSFGQMAEPLFWRCSVTWGPLNRTYNVIFCIHFATFFSRCLSLYFTRRFYHPFPTWNFFLYFLFSYFTAGDPSSEKKKKEQNINIAGDGKFFFNFSQKG